MPDNDTTETIGMRGQKLVEARLLDFGAKEKPLFRPVPLGDKWPATDLYVELLDSGMTVTPFFFIQVKSTNKGYQKKNGNLKVAIKKDGIARMAVIPAPTYLVGVEVKADREVFILAIRKKTKRGLTSLPRDYDLSYANLERLYDEVLSFWKANKAKPGASYFEV